MTRKYLFIFIIFSALHIKVKAQTQEYNKAIIVGHLLYYSDVKNNLHAFNMEDTAKGGSINSIPMFPSLTKEMGVLFKNPLVWDIIDSTLYIVNVYDDNFGMNYAQLRAYNLNELKKSSLLHPENLNNYINSSKTLKSRPIGPLEKYSSIITYKSDTLKGKIYFDLYCTQKTMHLFIYLESVKDMEIWTFTRYAVPQGDTGSDKKNEISDIYKKKPWEQLFSQSIDIACPFRAFTVNNKDFIIDAGGQVYHLDSTKIEKMQIHPVQNVIRPFFILNKDENELLYLDRKFLEITDGISIREKIAKYAVRILGSN